MSEVISKKDLQHVVEFVVPQIEEEHRVKVIFLVESGSRMWGFPSGDSDLDCRGVYVNKQDDMFRITRPCNVIEWKDEKNGKTYVDLSIWSIQKFGRHLQESNPSIYEWLQSPIVYLRTPHIDFAVDALSSYDRERLRSHYVSMAKGNFLRKCREDESGEVSAKKYIYVLRAVACVACLDTGKLPGVLYEEVIGYLPQSLQDKMRNYIKIKVETEDTNVPIDREMADFMAEFTQHNQSLKGTKSRILEKEIDAEVVRIMKLNLA